MLKHTLLIDGEFGFASTMNHARGNLGSVLYVGKVSIRRTTQLTFVCDSTPDSYQDAYQDAIGELEQQLEQRLVKVAAQNVQQHRQTGLGPDWLRLTIVRSWSNDVEEESNV